MVGNVAMILVYEGKILNEDTIQNILYIPFVCVFVRNYGNLFK